jgi:hypothetical protein
LAAIDLVIGPAEFSNWKLVQHEAKVFKVFLRDPGRLIDRILKECAALGSLRKLTEQCNASTVGGNEIGWIKLSGFICEIVPERRLPGSTGHNNSASRVAFGEVRRLECETSVDGHWPVALEPIDRLGPPFISQLDCWHSPLSHALHNWPAIEGPISKKMTKAGKPNMALDFGAEVYTKKSMERAAHILDLIDEKWPKTMSSSKKRETE